MNAQRRESARLWVILAREAPMAVIFRRGPSKQVRLIKWNLHNDTFECGQWFKGRIYEKRCDLSPDGKLLIYFASKQMPPNFPTWTAISKPPWFTALALWPHVSCWNGGGYFVTNQSVVLDPGPLPFSTEPAPGFQVKKLRVTIAPTQPGEDAPVWETTLQRDGWTLSKLGRQHPPGGGIRGMLINPPECWCKPHPIKPLVLEMAIHGIGGSGQRGWYHIRYQVLSQADTGLPEMDTDWADWDPKGDLLYARDGKIFRQQHRDGEFRPPIELINLNEQKFENIEAPPAAQQR